MNNLIIVKNKTALTTSLAIAEGTENKHKAVIQLVRKYTDDLSEFGGVAFEMRPFETAGGIQERTIAYLNEPQATLLMTYMSNTPVVRQFKKQLVKAFYKMAEKIRGEIDYRQVDIEHNRSRRLENPNGLDIKYSLDLTKIITQPNENGLRVLERLTGIDMEDIADACAPPLKAASDLKYSLTLFIDAACLHDETRRIILGQFHAAYVEWLAETEAPSRGNTPSKIAVGKELVRMGYEKASVSGNTWIYGLQVIKA